MNFSLQPSEVAVGTPTLQMRKQTLRGPVIYLQQHNQQVAECERAFSFSSQKEFIMAFYCILVDYNLSTS